MYICRKREILYIMHHIVRLCWFVAAYRLFHYVGVLYVCYYMCVIELLHDLSGLFVCVYICLFGFFGVTV